MGETTTLEAELDTTLVLKVVDLLGVTLLEVDDCVEVLEPVELVAELDELVVTVELVLELLEEDPEVVELEEDEELEGVVGATESDVVVWLEVRVTVEVGIELVVLLV